MVRGEHSNATHYQEGLCHLFLVGKAFDRGCPVLAGGGMVPVSSSMYSGPMAGGMGSPAMAQMPAIPGHPGMPPGHVRHMGAPGHYGGAGAPPQLLTCQKLRVYVYI